MGDTSLEVLFSESLGKFTKGPNTKSIVCQPSWLGKLLNLWGCISSKIVTQIHILLRTSHKKSAKFKKSRYFTSKYPQHMFPNMTNPSNYSSCVCLVGGVLRILLW